MEKSITMIELEKLIPHPDNPRKALGDLAELSESIKQKGVLQNLTVVPAEDGRYTVIIGHRRTAAARMAGLTELPCVVTEMTPLEQIQTMLLENMQRADLTPYEQAQSFQQLIDLGDTVDSLAQKTGFSETTVRRRLKMAELDPEKLKEASCRQCSLLDYDKLAQIENLKERNKVLEHIGTNNFEIEYKGAIKRQKIKKNLPLAKKWVKDHKAKPLSRNDTWGKGYERIGERIYLSDYEDPKIAKKYAEEQLFYLLDETYNEFEIYIKEKKAPPVKRPQKEIDRERYIRETRNQLDELTETAYKLRAEFVATLAYTKQNEKTMLDGAVSAILSSMFIYTNLRKEAICRALGLEWDYGRYDKCKREMYAGIEKDQSKTYPAIIYSMFSDEKARKYYSEYKGEFPKYQKNERLDDIYKWLVSLGYEMSDDEIALQNGTHELFVDKDKKTDAR